MARFDFTTTVSIDAEDEAQAIEMFIELFPTFDLEKPSSWDIYRDWDIDEDVEF